LSRAASLEAVLSIHPLPPPAGGRGRGEGGPTPALAAATLTLPSPSRCAPPSPALRERGFGPRARLALCLVLLLLAFLSAPARAACTGPIAATGAVHLAAAEAGEGAVAISFLGHASFLIESPAGVRIVTDYNDFVRAPVTPDIVTMNNAHTTHYSDRVEPGVKYVLRGWDPEGGIAVHRLEYRDVRIFNVATNVRESGGTRYNGNSIFVFDTAGLCIAHLSHLHHTLTPIHLAELGAIDVVMAPVDGAFTLNQEQILEVLQQIKPKIVIPMHIFTGERLEKFLARAADFYTVRRAPNPRLVLARADLPATPEIIVLPGK
jgi:L-ascorbate metabolism protein UlaG (beta-lactamase superfamily)